VKVDPSDFATSVTEGVACTTVTVARRIAVKACDGCPFLDYGSDTYANGCNLSPPGETASWRTDRRPDWGPLELGAVTVEVDR